MPDETGPYLRFLHGNLYNYLRGGSGSALCGRAYANMLSGPLATGTFLINLVLEQAIYESR